MRKIISVWFLLWVGAANAALYDRGNGYIYDDVLDITWMQDANYYGSTVIGSSGHVNKETAENWVDSLYFGNVSSADWRLPSTGPNPAYGYHMTGGELGHMFYNNLGNQADSDANCYPNCLINSSFVDAITGETVEIFNLSGSSQYWYNEAISDSLSWAFFMADGSQKAEIVLNNAIPWAVADGDIVGGPVVPIPAAAWLFGSALLGLGWVKRRRAETA